jgi:peptide chain release factor subunit 1
MFSFDLRALADLSGPDRAFLSIYFANPDDRGLLDARVREIRAFLSDQPTELEHFEENLKLARPLIDAPFGETSRAIFVCWALDYAQAHDLPVEVATLVRVDSSPYLRPLAELEDEYERFAVVVADNKGTSVYTVSAGDMRQAERVSGGVKNSVKKGGWSQKRYARRREKQLERYATRVAEQLEELHDEVPFERLVLLGQPEAMRAIEDALSNPMRERIIGEATVDVGDAQDVAEEKAVELYLEEERDEEMRLWNEIKAGYLSGGLGVAGPSRTLGALKTGRVEELLVARDAQIKGVRCRACENLAHGTPQTCYACGSSDLFEVDLVNEMAELAAQTSAHVEFADAFGALKGVGGVAALLRY